jgi:predicted dithiol-disulfide oxidoreductase (DUF899 family)
LRTFSPELQRILNRDHVSNCNGLNYSNLEHLMEPHKVVSPDEWLAARKAHLANEKQLTRLYDQLRAERMALPWVRIEKTYLFDTASGQQTLAELFAGRSQLIVRHFMLGPDWDEGCVGCSFGADHVDGALLHVEHHDVSFVAVSRAPLAKIEAYRQRMGWRFRWVSSFGSDFNYDFHVSFTEQDQARNNAFYNFAEGEFQSDELPGSSVFFKDDTGAIFHTYSSYARGGELGIGAYTMLDITPKGRNETGPHHNLMDWVKRHDQYADSTDHSHGCCAAADRS